ncbi:hypothetical protein ACFSSA_07075 [Luteolibacter algae]|uniref:Lipoprotein n=1 Tax=Luteolibacter algae TaxID=454151 RepID=A0ABW5D6Q6_9BACT
MKKTLLRSVRLALGIIAALALPGCLQNETSVTLNKDGSGTVVEETFLGAQMLAMMPQFSQPGAPDPIKEMFSDEKAKDKAAQMGKGVEYVKTELVDENGKKGARVHYKFADINTLELNAGGVMDDLANQAPAPAKPKKEKQPLKFSYADGKLEILIPPTNYEELELPEEQQNPQMEAMMTQMMADMRFSISLTITDGVKDTNASFHDGDKITLMDVQMGKVFAQKDKLKNIAEKAKTDEAAAKKEFSKLDGVKFETNEKVVVEVN